MRQRGGFVLALWLTPWLLAPGPALAAQEDDGPTVRTTVVVGGQVVVQDQASGAQGSGLTLSPRQETPADTVRRDAEALYAAGRLDPLAQPPQPVETVVRIDGVVAVEKSKSDTSACVQVGVVGARPKCRPGKP